MADKNELMEAEPLSLSTPIEELEKQLLAETDVDKLNDIISLFNINMKRKDIVRTGKLSELQDKIANQMTTRIDKNANEFSNKDLLDYYKAIQDTLGKASNEPAEVETPPSIQINQQINVEADTELSRESRERVKNFVASLLNSSEYQANNNIIDLDEIEVEDK